MQKRIELHAKTKYSIDNESTLDIKNLILKCASNGEKGISIVDTDSVISFYKAEKILKELNIKNFKLIYGVELNVIYNNKNYKIVVLLKKQKGISILFRILSPYFTNKSLHLEELQNNRKNFIIGLIYNENNYDDSLLKYIDYLEVDKNTKKDIINNLKDKTIVIYSNKPNALSTKEEISKKILYNKLNKKDNVETRVYQTTKEILNEVNDKEIVIDNPNKIFNMIEEIELLNDDMLLPCNNDFDIDLLVYINLNKKYPDNIPLNIRKRVEEELKLIHEYNYDGFINLYKSIIEKCKEENEEYVIYDYISYLYITYLLGITHFNPIKLDLNYDIFFSNYPKINLKLSESFSKKILKYINNDLGLNTIKCKTIMKLENDMLNIACEKYEEEYKIKLTNEEKVIIKKYLDNYPINNNAITKKELILPKDYNIFELTPRELISDGKQYYRFTNIDYKDIEHKFITLELISNDKIKELNELKDITNNKISNHKYQDNNIINSKEFKKYLKKYKKDLILDDLYEKLTSSNIELPDIFNIINKIKKEKTISKKQKELLDKNNIKLKKYHNINLINRSILYETTRLEYELLYFKIYYPLEYYYILLKNCPFINIINIISKGYDEVVNSINNYKDYQYEYKYLKLAKELYESDIVFLSDIRIIKENYCFKLDKDNNRIILIINKINSETEKYLSNNLSLIGTRPLNGKMPYISKIIHTLLEENKEITLFGLNSPTNYYLEYLLNEITQIDITSLNKYLNPCSPLKKDYISIDENKYLKGIKYLLNHNLTIIDSNFINNSIILNKSTIQEKLIYMINKSNSKIIIIDNIEYLSDNLDKILKQISKNKKVKFILFKNLKQEWEENHKNKSISFYNYQLLDKYIDYISILDKEEIYVLKEK